DRSLDAARIPDHVVVADPHGAGRRQDARRAIAEGVDEVLDGRGRLELDALRVAQPRGLLGVHVEHELHRHGPGHLEAQLVAQAPSLYDAARVIGDEVRRVSDMDRAALERDEFKFNVNLIVGGQVRGERPGLFIVYPQGNPLQASEDSPYLQIGETKYGRPILDRGIRFDKTTLEEAAKYALLS